MDGNISYNDRTEVIFPEVTLDVLSFTCSNEDSVGLTAFYDFNSKMLSYYVGKFHPILFESLGFDLFLISMYLADSSFGINITFNERKEQPNYLTHNLLSYLYIFSFVGFFIGSFIFILKKELKKEKSISKKGRAHVHKFKRNKQKI